MALKIEIKRGITRWVLLIGKYALKMPRIHTKREHWGCSWVNFLRGLMANMNENQFSGLEFDVLCPVVFYIPGGFLTVMLRASPLTDDQWKTLDVKDLLFNGDVSPDLVEYKRDSFGVLNGRIVAVDYG